MFGGALIAEDALKPSKSVAVVIVRFLPMAIGSTFEAALLGAAMMFQKLVITIVSIAGLVLASSMIALLPMPIL